MTKQNIDLVGVRLILLCQGKWSLKYHTPEFLNMAHHTHFLDSSLILFYHSGLNEPIRSQLFCIGLWGKFCKFVKHALLLSRSLFTVWKVEEDPTMTAQVFPKHFVSQAPMAMELGLPWVSALKSPVVPGLSNPVVPELPQQHSATSTAVFRCARILYIDINDITSFCIVF